MSDVVDTALLCHYIGKVPDEDTLYAPPTDFEILFARYRDATHELLQAQQRRLADEIRLRVADAEVTIAETLYRAAEQAVFDYTETL